jgi:hypothetical protein
VKEIKNEKNMTNCSVFLRLVDVTYFLLLKLSTAGMEGNFHRTKYSTHSGKKIYWGTKQEMNRVDGEADPRGLKPDEKNVEDEEEKNKQQVNTTYQLFRGANHQFIRTLSKLFLVLQFFIHFLNLQLQNFHSNSDRHTH